MVSMLRSVGNCRLIIIFLFVFIFLFLFLFLIPQVVKNPGVKTKKAQIKMSDGQMVRQVNWQSVVQKHRVEVIIIIIIIII